MFFPRTSTRLSRKARKASPELPLMLMTIDELSLPTAPAAQAVGCRLCGIDEASTLLSPKQVVAEGAWLKSFFRRRIRNTRAKDKVSFTQADATRIVRCVRCGTVFRNPQPNPAALKKKYAGDHYEPGALEALAANQAPFFAARAREFSSLLQRGAAILEVGSFTGAFLKAAEDAGWNATGMDIGAETVEFMRRAGLRVLRCDIGECRLKPAGWDAVFIWNTFDQLADPHMALDRVAQWLKPAGLIVLRIPNGDFKTGCLQLLEQSRAGSRAKNIRIAQAYNNFLTFPYLVGYTRDSIRTMLNEHGYDVLSTRGDTIVRLADAGTRPFAVEEEARYKRATMQLCRSIEAKTGRCYYPWLDVVARKASN